jgi:DNA-binding MarR family transcriptional regulator
MPARRTEVAELGNELIRLVKVLSAVKQHAPRLHPGLDAAAFPIMFALADGPLRVSEIAGRVHSDVSTVSRQTAGMIHLGVLSRESDPSDGRAVRLSLTDTGSDLLARLKSMRTELFSAALTDWTAEDVRSCHHYLARLTDDLTTWFGGSRGFPLSDRPVPATAAGQDHPLTEAATITEERA